MATSLDFILLPMVRHAGKERLKLPGLYTASPPRRSARGRSSDRLFIYLSMEGNAPLSPKELEKLLAHMANAYYQTTGSSTAAMRSVAEALNELLLKRNLNSANRGRQAVGMLTLGVVRFNNLYLLQSGSSHGYLIAVDGTKQLYDPEFAGRGLGLSRATTLRFHQTELKPGDVLVVSPNPPMTWNTTTLRNMHGLSLKDLYQRLIRRSAGDLEAFLMLAQHGKGEMRLVLPQPTREQSEKPTESTTPQTRVPEQVTPVSEPARRVTEPKVPVPSVPDPEPKPKPKVVEAAPRKQSVEPVEPPPEKPQREPVMQSIRQTVGPGLQTIGKAVGETIRQATQATSTLLERMLPDESIMTLPGSTMAFIAVAVPLVVVAVAAAVYFQRGRMRYFDAYFIQAQQAVEQAQQFEGASDQRIAWKAALEYLDLAEAYQETEDSQNLRNFATMALDNLDRIVRLSFNPAVVDGLPATVEISRIVVNLENELYFLDGVDGKVYRAIFNGDKYVLDTEFSCGPVPEPLIVGPLVDIEALAPGYPNGAAVIGMDNNGNLAFCIPGDAQLSYAMPPPDSNWGTPQAFAMDYGDLYVLDPVTNSVWIYDGASEYRELPNYFFGAQVPPMQDVVDLTVSGGRLFLLHHDGHLTTSYYGGNDYVDPMIYQDPRDGFADGPLIADAAFDQIQFAPPPDPSIYMLDSDGRSIYHFSLQAVFQRQYHSSSALPDGPITAFAVSSNHQIFVAIGNKIYYALLP